MTDDMEIKTVTTVQMSIGHLADLVLSSTPDVPDGDIRMRIQGISDHMGAGVNIQGIVATYTVADGDHPHILPPGTVLISKPVNPEGKRQADSIIGKSAKDAIVTTIELVVLLSMIIGSLLSSVIHYIYTNVQDSNLALGYSVTAVFAILLVTCIIALSSATKIVEICRGGNDEGFTN